MAEHDDCLICGGNQANYFRGGYYPQYDKYECPRCGMFDYDTGARVVERDVARRDGVVVGLGRRAECSRHQTRPNDAGEKAPSGTNAAAGST
jgi:ribosomal protein S27AE